MRLTLSILGVDNKGKTRRNKEAGGEARVVIDPDGSESGVGLVLHSGGNIQVGGEVIGTGGRSWGAAKQETENTS